MDINKAARYAIDNVLKEGITDIFDRPFEIDLLNDDSIKKDAIEYIVKCIKSNSVSGLEINNIEYVLMPKKMPFSFRRCAFMHPMDTLKYLSIVLSIAKTIESSRIHCSKKKVFSYRLHFNGGYIFNRNYIYSTFVSEVRRRKKMRKNNIMISCDIANFYDRLNLHRLENILNSISCDRTIVKLLIQLLMTWNGRDSYGLPVGSNASRILAEASLIPVDNYMIENKIEFVRFVDDYRIFAPDFGTAQYWLVKLIDRLSVEGFSVNPVKTKLEDISNNIVTRSSVKKIFQHRRDINALSDENPFIIKAGYGGFLPQKFVKPSAKECARLQNIDIVRNIDIMNTQCMPSNKLFIETIKSIDVQKKYEKVIDVNALIEKNMQIFPYFSDMLIKCANNYDNDIISKIRDFYTKKLSIYANSPPYIIAACIKLLGNKHYNNKQALIKFFINMKRQDNVYVGRAILESLRGIISRDDAIEIKRYYNKSDIWEKRCIISIISRVFDDDEKNAWLTNLKHIEVDEFFLMRIISKEKKNKRKGKSCNKSYTLCV